MIREILLGACIGILAAVGTVLFIFAFAYFFGLVF
jgi:hypothetical protein